MAMMKVIQMLEVNFWELFILTFQEEGPIMKLISSLKRMMRTKAGYLAILIIVWSGIGFLIGLVLGRVIWMLQLL
jgi:hypothetical protein